MTAIDFLIYNTQRRLDAIFEVARTIPADKLDWKASAESRSALDQLQEVATCVDEFWAAHAERKVEWNPEKFVAWQERRGKITDLDELQKIANEEHARLFEAMRGMSEEYLALPVEMPFQRPFTVLDILAYYSWNASYHEGQITFIKTLLADAA